MTIQKIALFLSFFLVLACNRTTQNIDASSTLSYQDTQNILATISADEMNGRYTGSEGYDKAAEFAIDYLKSHGIQPLFSTFRDSLLIKDIESYNVVGINHKYNKNRKTVIISAHLDHLKPKTTGDDLIMNGANDDASGVTAAMQISTYLAHQKKIKQNVIVALFTGEEMGLLGSSHLANRLKENNIVVDLVLNFEMIGTELTDAPNTVYLTGYEKSDLAAAINMQAQRELVVFLPSAKKMNLFKRSDNYSFYKAFDIPAQTFSSFDFTNFEYYHHPDDEIQALDIENMNEIINSMAEAINGLLINNITVKLTEE